MTDNRPDASHTTNADATPSGASDADASTNPPGARSEVPATRDGSAASAGGRASVPEAGQPESAREEGNLQPPRYAPPQQEGFDWRGWVLVSIVVVSFLLVPGAILALPYAQSFVESLGLTFRAAYLALPMIPALLLGATAVWAAVRSRRS